MIEHVSGEFGYRQPAVTTSSGMVIGAIAVIGLSLALSSTPGTAQRGEPLEYRNRGNRMEGIEKLRMVGGADIDLAGALIKSGDFPPVDSIKSLRLRFYLTDSAAMKIKVRDLLGKNYLMVPHRQQWRKGWNDFRWPAGEILQKIPLQPDELAVIDSIYAKAPGFVVPFVLTCDERRAMRQKYRFVFITNGWAQITVKWLRKSDSHYRELESYSLEEPANTPFVVERDFEMSESEGYCRLQLRGRIKRLDTIIKVEREYDFYHKNTME
jgi:hypothetical protein